MKNIFSVEKYIEMGKIKVVPVENEAPTDVGEEEVKEEEPEVKQEDVKQEELAIVAPVVEESKPKAKKEQTMISCENCGKSMLMKTYKYSHLKLCKPPTPEPPPPPPPPPPTPEPKAKAKRAPKPKEDKPVLLKPEFNGEVSFNHVNEPPLSHIDIYRQAREQRQQVRVQRVRSLIAQAI